MDDRDQSIMVRIIPERCISEYLSVCKLRLGLAASDRKPKIIMFKAREKYIFLSDKCR